MPASMILAAIGAQLTGMALAVATFAINFAVSAIVSRVFTSKPDAPQETGSRQQMPPSSDNPIPIAYGDAWLGGKFVDAVLSVDQKTMYYVMAISHVSPDGLFTFDTSNFYYGDRKITFDGTDLTKVVSLTDGAGNVDTKIADDLYIWLYRSTEAGVITPLNSSSLPSVVMGGSDIAVAQQWTGIRQMNGLAFAIVKLNYNTADGITGLSPLTFKVNHYLNGAGVARPGDVFRDYLNNSVYGGAVLLQNINTTACDALNTYSDALITYTPSGGGSATQARYRINGVIDTGEQVLSNINKIMMACDSWMSYEAVTGQWTPVINKDTATSFAFNDSNIIGDIRVSVTDLASSINQIEASFPFKGNKDQPEYIRLKTPTVLLYPNEPVNKLSTSFDLVNDSVQAEYLANRLLEQAREDLIVSFSTAYTGIQVNAGDVVSVTNAAYGWTDKLFRVLKVQESSLPDGNLGAHVELSEYNAQVYDDLSILQFSPSPNSNLVSGYYFSSLPAPTVGDLNPTATVPTFSVTCQIPSSGRVTSLVLFYTTVSSPSVTDWKVWGAQAEASGGTFTPSSSIKFPDINLPAATYYFAYRVSNDLATSELSVMSSAHVWNPTGAIGPTGPTGTSITGPTGATGASITGPTGATGNQSAAVYLYQWATAQPSNPTGSSTYTWATGANSAYTATDGWAVAIPANPGTPGIYLWYATKTIVVPAGTVSTSIDWTVGITVGASTGNGIAGQKTARPSVYQWALTIPTISGTSTYTWATGAISAIPSGWSAAPTASTPGFTLWQATVSISDADAATTTSINWSTASILASGYAGATGAQARVMYARIASNPTPVAGTVTVTGNNRPTGAQASAVWGASFNVTWYANDPDPASNNSLYQADGVYDNTNTAWSTPYISSLKVGALSAVSVNTGTLTVSGSLTVGTVGNVKGGQTDYNSGTGFFLGYSGAAYKFSIGTASKSLTWDGTDLSVIGGSINTSVAGARISINQSANNKIQAYDLSSNLICEIGGGTGVVYATSSSTLQSTIQGYATGYFSGVYGSHISSSGISNSSASGVRGYASGTTSRHGVFAEATVYESVYGESVTYGATNHGVRGKNLNGAGSGSATAGIVGGANGYDFYADGAGINYGPFTGSHDGLMPNNFVCEPGNIVVDVACIARKNWSNTLFEVAQSSQANQANVVGVVALVNGPLSMFSPSALISDQMTENNDPIMIPLYDQIKDQYTLVAINAVGEGQMYVCGQNGNISNGDYICTSDTPGKGMKQTSNVLSNTTVAKARENVTFDFPEQIKQVACFYVSG